MWKEVKLRGSLRKRCCKGAAARWLPRLNLLQPEGWAGSPQSELELKGACPQARGGKRGVLLLPSPSAWEGGMVAQGG